MKKLLIGLISLVGFFSIQNDVLAQVVSTSSTANVKASASISAVCFISSQNVNFGQIMLPVSAQSATSSMSVTCTKGSNYTIGLAYGGIYGKGGTPTGNYWVNVGCAGNSLAGTSPAACYSYGVWYYEYNASGAKISQVEVNWQQGQHPTGTSGGSTVGVVNNELYSSYSYGLLTGAASSDTIGYAIQVPNNSAEIWNNGNYTYSSTGTGSAQSIPIVAKLIPSDTAHSYPTADTYLDTVTATIAY